MLVLPEMTFIRHKLWTMNTNYLQIGSFIFIEDFLLAMWFKFSVIFVGDISVSIYTTLDTTKIGQHSTTYHVQGW
jgi:hypothetical protein